MDNSEASQYQRQEIFTKQIDKAAGSNSSMVIFGDSNLDANKWQDSPAVVAWFVKASVFHSVNSAPSANGGSNPAWECCIDRLNSKEFVAIQIARYNLGLKYVKPV